jgi:hypothetical protein
MPVSRARPRDRRCSQTSCSTPTSGSPGAGRHTLHEHLGIAQLLAAAARGLTQCLRCDLGHFGEHVERDLRLEECQPGAAREEVDGSLGVFVLHCVAEFCVQNCVEGVHSGKRMVGYSTGGRGVHGYNGLNRLPYSGHRSPVGSRYSQTVHARSS